RLHLLASLPESQRMTSEATTSAPAPPEADDQLWSRQFVQLCAGGFLSYASQTPIMPIIALWVVHLGGSATTVGLVAAAFSAPSSYLQVARGSLGFYLPYLALKMKAFAGFWLPFLVTAIAGLLAAPTVIGMKERPKSRAAAASLDAAGNVQKESLLDQLFERE